MQFIPDAEKRKRTLPRIFDIFVRYCFKYGEIYATSESFEGVIMCLPSESWQISPWRMLRCGAWKLPFLLGFKFISRMTKIEEKCTYFHTKYASNPHTYIWHLGVEPEFQGKGCGGKLLRHLLKRLTEERRTCYLETAEEKNVAFYRHFGFEVVDMVEFADLQLIIWALLKSQINSE